MFFSASWDVSVCTVAQSCPPHLVLSFIHLLLQLTVAEASKRSLHGAGLWEWFEVWWEGYEQKERRGSSQRGVPLLLSVMSGTMFCSFHILQLTCEVFGHQDHWRTSSGPSCCGHYNGRILKKFGVQKRPIWKCVKSSHLLYFNFVNKHFQNWVDCYPVQSSSITSIPILTSPFP